MPKLSLQLTLLVVILLTACLSPVQGDYLPDTISGISWVYTDLRAIDPADAAADMDLLAAYLRQQDDRIQFRIDFMDLGEVPNFDTILLIDIRPFENSCMRTGNYYGTDCDLAVLIPAHGDIQLRNTDQRNREQIDYTQANIQIYRDPVLDFMTISLPVNLLNNAHAKRSYFFPAGTSPFTFKVLVTPSETDRVADELSATRSDSSPPPPAPVLFAFTNTFPAYSPASALRRWDGAHTGPWGGRHGLYNLLRTARNHNIPIALMDVSSPAALSALDFGNYLRFLQDMLNEQLLLLPKVLPVGNSLLFTPTPDIYHALDELDSSAAENFQLPESRMLYSPFGLKPIQEWFETGSGELPEVIFIPGTVTSKLAQETSTGNLTSIYGWQGATVIPIPSTYQSQYSSPGIEQAGTEGLTLPMRKALIETALLAGEQHDKQSTFMVLGGELPESTWGIPQAARASFNYIASHPWIKPLNVDDLISISTSANPLHEIEPPEYTNPVFDEIIVELVNAPQNALSSAGWQYLSTLYATVTPHPSELAQLRTHYVGQIGALISASHWADQPTSTATCSLDIDYDGEPECILANDSIYTIYDQDSGALTYAFARSASGDVHQIISPSSQLITGLSDPESWDLGQGLSADPDVIIGAFASPDPPDEVSVGERNLVFQWEENDILEITYTLNSDSIIVDIVAQSTEQIHTQIPFVIDPWIRFSPDYSSRYKVSSGEGTLLIKLIDGPSISLISSGTMTYDHFAYSQNLLAVPENPNREYPPGHYLPFPLIRVDLRVPSKTDPGVEITINP